MNSISLLLVFSAGFLIGFITALFGVVIILREQDGI